MGCWVYFSGGSLEPPKRGVPSRNTQPHRGRRSGRRLQNGRPQPPQPCRPFGPCGNEGSGATQHWNSEGFLFGRRFQWAHMSFGMELSITLQRGGEYGSQKRLNAWGRAILSNSSNCASWPWEHDAFFGCVRCRIVLPLVSDVSGSQPFSGQTL